MPNVQWKIPDDGQKNCPKHVEFLDKNKFGKLMRLLVLLKRILKLVYGCKWIDEIFCKDVKWIKRRAIMMVVTEMLSFSRIPTL